MTPLSPYLIAIVAGWVVAQGSKYVVVAFKTKNLRDIRQLYLSGNMPSAHTATAFALLTVVGYKDGVESGLFGLAALFTAIVMYDAVMVRRSSGEQGIALQQLMKEVKSLAVMPRAAKGHTPLEVFVGALVGCLVGIVVFFATN